MQDSNVLSDPTKCGWMTEIKVRPIDPYETGFEQQVLDMISEGCPNTQDSTPSTNATSSGIGETEDH